MKYSMCIATIGVVGASIASFFGGWDAALKTLIIFMAADYICGLVVAGIFHASKHSTGGRLESREGMKGLFRKAGALLCVLIAAQLDTVLGSDFPRDAVVIAFICNEAISILENLGLMGVPVPQRLKDAVDALKNGKED